MKSVIEEGSSIAKAIENGWLKAGKPKEFTVKVFQESKKNFFGFNTVVAKVGIFFYEDSKEKEKFQYKPRPQNPNQRPHNPNQNPNNNPNRNNPRPQPKFRKKDDIVKPK